MTCHECGKEIGERKGYVNDRGRIFHPGCMPSPDYERGRAAGFAEAIEMAARFVDDNCECEWAQQMTKDIRALAPATTTEEPT